MKPKFLHRDSTLVVIHKPAGMTVYREPENREISAQDWVKTRVPNGQCHPVHRLDKGTCGVLIFALTPPVANLMQKLFREGRVEKRYRAIVHGSTPSKGEFRNPLSDSKSRETKTARTVFRTLQTFLIGDDSYSVVEVDPKTGRFHQIRRHFSMNGFPLVGDEKYKGIARLIRRPALSAVRVQFVHPGTRRLLTVQSDPDPDFQSVLRKLDSLERKADSASSADS